MIPDLNRTKTVIPRSFDDFYRNDYRSVVGLAFVLTGDWSAAEDLAQDAFLKAHKAWATIAGFDSPGAWVRKVMVNASRSAYRRRQTEVRALRLVGAASRSSDELRIPETSSEVWRAVRRLPRRQGEAVALTYYGGCSRQEVAEILGCSPFTVKTHLQRGKKALASQLGAEDAI